MSVHICDVADTSRWRGRFAIRASATGFPPYVGSTSTPNDPTRISRPTLGIQRLSLAKEGSLFSSASLALSPCESVLGFALNPLMDASGSAIGLLPLGASDPHNPSRSTNGAPPQTIFSACKPEQRTVNGIDPWSGDGGGDASGEGCDVTEMDGDISSQVSWVECPPGISPTCLAWCGVPGGGDEGEAATTQQLLLLGSTKGVVWVGAVPDELFEFLKAAQDASGGEGVSVPLEVLGSLRVGPDQQSPISSLVPFRSALFGNVEPSSTGVYAVAGVSGTAVHIWDLCGDELPLHSLPAFVSAQHASLHHTAFQHQNATSAAWAAAASPTGQVVAVGGSAGALLLYDCRSDGKAAMVVDGYTSQVYRHRPGRLGSISSIDFSPLIPWAVAVSSQATRTAHLFDVRFPCAPVSTLSGGDGGASGGTFSGMSQLRHPQGGISSVQWMPQRSDTLCSASADGVVRVWTCRASLSNTSQWDANNRNDDDDGGDEDAQEVVSFDGGSSLQLVGSARVSAPQLQGGQSQWLTSSTSFSSSAVASMAVPRSAARGNIIYALSAEGTLASVEVPCSTLRHVAPTSLFAADIERERKRSTGATLPATPSTLGEEGAPSPQEAATQRMLRDERLLEGLLYERSLPETARGVLKCAQRRAASGHLQMALDICSLLHKAELVRQPDPRANPPTAAAMAELGEVMWPRLPSDTPSTVPQLFCIQRLVAYFSAANLGRPSRTPTRLPRSEVMSRAFTSNSRLMLRELAALSERIPSTVGVCEWEARAVAGTYTVPPTSSGLVTLGNLPPSVGLPHPEMLARVSAARLNIRIAMLIRSGTLLTVILKPAATPESASKASTISSPIAAAAIRVLQDVLRSRPDFVEHTTVCEIVRTMKRAAIAEAYTSGRTRFAPPASSAAASKKVSPPASPVLPPTPTFDDVYAFVVGVCELLLGWTADPRSDADETEETEEEEEEPVVEAALTSVHFSGKLAKARFGDKPAPSRSKRAPVGKTHRLKETDEEGDDNEEGDDEDDDLGDMLRDLDGSNDDEPADGSNEPASDDGPKEEEEEEDKEVEDKPPPPPPQVQPQSVKKKAPKLRRARQGRNTHHEQSLTAAAISKIKSKALSLAKATIIATLEPLLSDNTSISPNKLRRLHRSFLVGVSGNTVDSDGMRAVLASVREQLRVAQMFHELRGLQMGLREAGDEQRDRATASASRHSGTAADNRQISLYRQRIKMVSANVIAVVTKYQRKALEEHQAFNRRSDGSGDLRVGVFGWLGETPIVAYLKALLSQGQHVPFFWSCQQFLDAHRRFLPRRKGEGGDGRCHTLRYTSKEAFSKGLRRLAAKTKAGVATGEEGRDVPLLCFQVENMTALEILRLDAAADAVVVAAGSILNSSSEGGGSSNKPSTSMGHKKASFNRPVVPTSREQKLENITAVLASEVHPYIISVGSIIGEIKTVGLHSGTAAMPPLIDCTLEVLSDIEMRVCGAWSQLVELAEAILQAVKESGDWPRTGVSASAKPAGVPTEAAAPTRSKDNAVTSVLKELQGFHNDVDALIEGCIGLGDFEPLALVAEDVARVLATFN